MNIAVYLTEQEIQEALVNLPDWHVENGTLRALFTFPDFAAAFSFMTLAAEAAEAMSHHPEWTNVYNTVDVTLVTHDAGDAITDLDVRLAQAMSGAALAVKP